MILTWKHVKKGQPDSEEMTDVGTREEVIKTIRDVTEKYGGKSSCIYHVNGDITINISFHFGTMLGYAKMVSETIEELGALPEGTRFSFVQRTTNQPWDTVYIVSQKGRGESYCYTVDEETHKDSGVFIGSSRVVRRPSLLEQLKKQHEDTKQP